MSDEKVTNLDAVRAQYTKAKPHEAKPKKARGGGGEPPKPPPPPSDDGDIFPPVLPWNSPVRALGVNGRTYYFLSKLGQFHQLLDKDINMNPILGLFGGDSDYLRTWWPKFDRSGKHVINFDHGMLREVLIRSCSLPPAGIWSPEQNVRGVGTWAEDDGTLVMHCGDRLFLSNGPAQIPGVRGRLLYPGAPAQPHPETGAAGEGGPCDALLAKCSTWNWQRGALDAQLHVAWIVAAMLGAAPAWRPIEWITGGSGTGKSTLMRLTRWVMGPKGMVTSEDATPAGIKQRVGDSSIAVSIDELESEANSSRAQDIMKLARIASSGGESLRGSPGGVSMSFISRNAFQFSSIVIPSLPQQDKNRLFIGALDAVEWAGRQAVAKREYEPGADWSDDEEIVDDESDDPILGSKTAWELVGRQLRGRILGQWPRYARTLRAYRKALDAAGHNSRGCDQFGALGAAFDIAMHDGFDAGRALEFATQLPAQGLAETSGYKSSHEACLSHLLGTQVDAWKGGAKESVSRLLQGARLEIKENVNDLQTCKLLQSMGIKVMRDKTVTEFERWLIVICNNHPGVARIYRDTDWRGIAGAPGAWAQMMARLDGAITKGGGGGPLKLRFSGIPEYCVALPWDNVFPPSAKDDDEAEFGGEERS